MGKGRCPTLARCPRAVRLLLPPSRAFADESRSPDSCCWRENLGSVCKATGADVCQWSQLMVPLSLLSVPNPTQGRVRAAAVLQHCPARMSIPLTQPHLSHPSPAPRPFAPRLPLTALNWGVVKSPPEWGKDLYVTWEGDPKLSQPPPGSLHELSR